MTAITVDDISDTDVLCGRGSRINTHPGNVTYREICQAYMSEYGQAKKVHKPLVSKRIVQLIKEQGGKFLQRTSVPDQWEEIEDKKAAEKTGQALRSSLYSAQAVDTEVKHRKARTDMCKRMLVTPPRDNRCFLPRHQEPTLMFEVGVKKVSSSASSRSGDSTDGSSSPSAVPQLYSSSDMMQQSLNSSWLPPNMPRQISLDQQSSDAFALQQQLQLMQLLQAQQRQHQLDLWNPRDLGSEESLLFS